MSATTAPPPGPTAKTTYTLAVCLYLQFGTLDYQGPIEILSTFSAHSRENFGSSSTSSPRVLLTGTYKGAMDEGKQYDIIFIPGGSAHPGSVDPSLLEFIKNQYPKAKHILAACTGSWILAGTGLLNGKKATTNKAMFKVVEENTKDLNITWVPKARWVITDDKKIWTSSGVTAGMDLANAYMEYFVGNEFAYEACKLSEYTPRGEDEDEWAAVHGLVV
ncbi:hypothetical protein VKT23_010072 [Stygiomarasmius scandens]|uniref:DJ-1/PfpI domain-containing protein n=1 Tax=Marasmiellus scandens TaxID=2682957 RepID=A0ABR1JDL1_9AGAR